MCFLEGNLAILCQSLKVCVYLIRYSFDTVILDTYSREIIIDV